MLQGSLRHAVPADCAGKQESTTTLTDLDSVPDIGQGILLVTEHKAEINAGFIVLFGSAHSSILTGDDWKTCLPLMVRIAIGTSRPP